MPSVARRVFSHARGKRFSEKSRRNPVKKRRKTLFCETRVCSDTPSLPACPDGRFGQRSAVAAQSHLSMALIAAYLPLFFTPIPVSKGTAEPLRSHGEELMASESTRATAPCTERHARMPMVKAPTSTLPLPLRLQLTGRRASTHWPGQRTGRRSSASVRTPCHHWQCGAPQCFKFRTRSSAVLPLSGLGAPQCSH